MDAEYEILKLAIDERFKIVAALRNHSPIADLTGFSAALGIEATRDTEHISSTKSLVTLGIQLRNSEGQRAVLRLFRQFSTHPYYAYILAVSGVTKPFVINSLARQRPIDKFSVHPGNLITSTPEAVRQLLADKLAEYGVGFPIERLTLRKLEKHISSSFTEKKINDFQDISTYVRDMNTVLWPFFFSSVFSSVINLFDVGRILTKQSITESFLLAYTSGFEKLVSRLLILRALAGHKVERQYVLNGNHDLLKNSALSIEITDSISDALRNKSFSFDDIESSFPIERLIRLQLFLYSSSDEKDFLYRLADVYEADEASIDFIDWNRLAPFIQHTAGVTIPHLVFLSTILSAQNVTRRFKFLFFSYWQGGATADLEHYALYIRGRAKESSLVDFLKSLMVLPPRARTRVFKHLFHPTVVERLVTILTPIRSRLSLPRFVKDEYFALFGQLLILEFLDKKDVLPQNVVDIRRDELRDFIRHLHYSSDRNSGMIKIDQYDFENEVRRFFTNNYVTIISAVHAIRKLCTIFNSTDSQLVKTFSYHLSLSLAKHVCFSSRIAFDYILSNRLRHGWLERRLEKAVLDFGQGQACRGSDLDMQALCGALKHLVDQFCLEHLTLKSDNQAFEGFVNLIQRWFERHLPNDPEPPLVEKVPELAGQLIDSLSQMLDRAKQAWATTYREQATQLVESSVNSRMERDQLLANFNAAFAETSMWIAVNSRTGIKDEPLSLRHLVDFEVSCITVRNPRETSVTFEIYDDNGGHQRRHNHDVLVPRRYFDVVISIVDNAIQNAFKNSGLQYKTQLNVALSVSKQMVKLDIMNRFRPRDTKKMQRKLIDARAAIGRALALGAPELLKGRSGEGGSGTIKMIYECREAFDQRFVIDATNRFFKDNWFCLHVELPIVGAILRSHQ